MMHYERSYGTSRFVFALLEIIGFLVLIVGILAAAGGYWTGGLTGAFLREPPIAARLLALLPGIGIAIGGVFTIANAQSGRANVDSAEMTRDMLILMRESAPSHASIEPPRRF